MTLHNDPVLFSSIIRANAHKNAIEAVEKELQPNAITHASPDYDPFSCVMLVTTRDGYFNSPTLLFMSTTLLKPTFVDLVNTYDGSKAKALYNYGRDENHDITKYSNFGGGLWNATMAFKSEHTQFISYQDHPTPKDTSYGRVVGIGAVVVVTPEGDSFRVLRNSVPLKHQVYGVQYEVMSDGRVLFRKDGDIIVLDLWMVLKMSQFSVPANAVQFSAEQTERDLARFIKERVVDFARNDSFYTNERDGAIRGVTLWLYNVCPADRLATDANGNIFHTETVHDNTVEIEVTRDLASSMQARFMCPDNYCALPQLHLLTDGNMFVWAMDPSFAHGNEPAVRFARSVQGIEPTKYTGEDHSICRLEPSVAEKHAGLTVYNADAHSQADAHYMSLHIYLYEFDSASVPDSGMLIAYRGGTTLKELPAAIVNELKATILAGVYGLNNNKGKAFSLFAHMCSFIGFDVRSSSDMERLESIMEFKPIALLQAVHSFRLEGSSGKNWIRAAVGAYVNVLVDVCNMWPTYDKESIKFDVPANRKAVVQTAVTRTLFNKAADTYKSSGGVLLRDYLFNFNTANCDPDLLRIYNEATGRQSQQSAVRGVSGSSAADVDTDVDVPPTTDTTTAADQQTYVSNIEAEALASSNCNARACWQKRKDGLLPRTVFLFKGTVKAYKIHSFSQMALADGEEMVAENPGNQRFLRALAESRINDSRLAELKTDMNNGNIFSYVESSTGDMHCNKSAEHITLMHLQRALVGTKDEQVARIGFVDERWLNLMNNILFDFFNFAPSTKTAIEKAVMAGVQMYQNGTPFEDIDITFPDELKPRFTFRDARHTGPVGPPTRSAKRRGAGRPTLGGKVRKTKSGASQPSRASTSGVRCTVRAQRNLQAVESSSDSESDSPRPSRVGGRPARPAVESDGHDSDESDRADDAKHVDGDSADEDIDYDP